MDIFRARQLLSCHAGLEVHSRRVSTLALKVAKILKMPAADIAIAGYLHDLGKTIWPPELFDKYPLMPADWGFIKSHPLVSENIAVDIWPGIPDFVRKLIRSHHERPDGTGYPDELASLSDDLLLLAACDSFDAMTSARIYRPQGALTPEYALREIAGFAPVHIVSALAHAVKEIAV